MASRRRSKPGRRMPPTRVPEGWSEKPDGRAASSVGAKDLVSMVAGIGGRGGDGILAARTVCFGDSAWSGKIACGAPPLQLRAGSRTALEAANGTADTH